MRLVNPARRRGSGGRSAYSRAGDGLPLDFVLERSRFGEAVAHRLDQIAVLLRPLPLEELLERLPLARDQPAVRILRRLADLVQDVPWHSLGHQVPDPLVGLEELLRVAGLEFQDEDHAAFRLAHCSDASFSSRSLMTLICTLVFLFMYSSAVGSSAGALGFIEKS